MGLTTHTIDGPIAEGLKLRPELEWTCGTSWDGSLLAFQCYADEIDRLLAQANSPLARGFLVLEFRCAVVELLEYVAGVFHALRHSGSISHIADNRVLTGVFETLKAGVTHEDAASFLYLPPLPPTCGDPDSDKQLAAAYSHILRNAVMCLADIGTYWLDHITATRWYRHCPAFLSLEDCYKIEPAENPQREEVRREHESFADTLFTFVQQDRHSLHHETLRLEDFDIARHMMRITFAIILPSFGNRVLAPKSPDPTQRLHKIHRALASGLNPDDILLLCAHGPFLFTP